MEVSVIGSSQKKIGLACNELKILFSTNNCKVFCSPKSFGSSRRRGTAAGVRLTIKAVQSAEPVLSDKDYSSKPRSKPLDGVKLFVGLPLDAVADCNTVSHARAIAAGLKALKLLGVDGVELPIWWGVVEKEAMGKYEWSAYLALAEMVQKAGLKLHVSLCFHACKESKIPLPQWVSTIGESQPSIFFTDKSGQQYKECLSLGIDNLPVLNGKTAIEVYQEFCDSFKSSFAPFMGSTITGISMGLGPDGELRYPSQHRRLAKKNKVTGVGEFQCYDKNMLSFLKQHAEATGNPCWGLGGPHDTPTYDQVPSLFFNDHGGSWETPYGDYFLSWYSSQLVSHGNRLLSLASSTFSDKEVTIYGKVPLIHSWYKTRARSSELTAGFYNTITKDGYEAVAETFAKNSCKMILPGMDLSDEHQSQESRSSPELLLGQIRAACRKHGVEVSGQNSAASGVIGGFQKIKKNLLEDDLVDLFTYHRMGAYFFSPEHFPSFTEFVRSLNQQELHSDDLPTEEEEASISLPTTAESGAHMQVA